MLILPSVCLSSLFFAYVLKVLLTTQLFACSTRIFRLDNFYGSESSPIFTTYYFTILFRKKYYLLEQQQYLYTSSHMDLSTEDTLKPLCSKSAKFSQHEIKSLNFLNDKFGTQYYLYTTFTLNSKICWFKKAR